MPYLQWKQASNKTERSFCETKQSNQRELPQTLGVGVEHTAVKFICLTNVSFM